MKFIRFSILFAIAGLFASSLITSCRHTSPTGPLDTLVRHDTTTPQDTGCCHGRITLTMTDSATGHLLTGGMATLYDNDVPFPPREINAQTGTVAWDGLCPGNYHVIVSKDGYHTETFHLDSMGCNGTETPHHVLSPVERNSGDTCCHGILQIAVTDSANGENITGATVSLTNRTTGATYTRTTSAGMVRFDGLCPGSYRCVITDEHFTTGVLEFNMTCNDSQSLSKTLAPVSTSSTCDTASITLHVLDSVHRDMNITGATVTIRIDGHQDNFTSGTTTDGGYFYTHHNLPSPDTYIITISKDGYNTKTIDMRLGDCRNYTETVYLSQK